MLWQTSPAATEMETVVLDWLRQALGLPDGFSGVIQDSASTATLAAVLVMREKALDFAGNTTGLAGSPTLRVYASSEVHTSIDRAIWISGIGGDNLVRDPDGGPPRGMDAGRARGGHRSPTARPAFCPPGSSPASAAPASAPPTTSPPSPTIAGATASCSTSTPPGRARR